jgi:hypothetical protein
MPTLLKLPRQWTVDFERPLGRSGGFGAVYEGWSLDGENVAIKVFHAAQDASVNRELAFARGMQGRRCAHIVEIF